LMVQVAPAARDVPQVFVVENWSRLTPPRVTLAMLSAVLPPLVRVTFWMAESAPAFVLGKVSVVPESVACGTGVVLPAPLRVRFWVAPLTLPELSTTVTSRFTVPEASGTKTMEIVQVAEAGSEAPQVVAVWLKLEALPVSRMDNVAVALPVFETVTVIGLLV